VDKRLITLENIEALHFIDSDGEEYFGFDQEWFCSPWQRMAGCGPTVAATLLHYLSCTRGAPMGGCVSCKGDRLKLMENVWRHVTPGMGGVHKLSQFTQGALDFAGEYSFAFDCITLSIPRKKETRPDLAGMVSFIADGLAQDCPVAFLNLSNGKVENLDEWHWVTIVCLETCGSPADAHVTIYDEGKIKTVDLNCWQDKIRAGGGFTYFRYEPEKPV
jgi:hypothetical protein